MGQAVCPLSFGSAFLRAPGSSVSSSFLLCRVTPTGRVFLLFSFSGRVASQRSHFTRCLRSRCPDVWDACRRARTWGRPAALFLAVLVPRRLLGQPPSAPPSPVVLDGSPSLRSRGRLPAGVSCSLSFSFCTCSCFEVGAVWSSSRAEGFPAVVFLLVLRCFWQLFRACRPRLLPSSLAPQMLLGELQSTFLMRAI